MIASLLAAAMPVPNSFKPLAPLIGHCWRAALSDGGTDTHCFSLIDRGRHVRDRHEVTLAGERVYWGVTLYTAIGGAIRYEYRNAHGVVGHGSTEIAAGTIVFRGDGSPERILWTIERRGYVVRASPVSVPVRFVRAD